MTNQELNIDLMILGVEKAGTTALFRHIGQSPMVCMHEQREMFFFYSDEEYARGWDYAKIKYFPECIGDSKLIVAKNVMQITSELSLKRLKNQCPEVRCVVMLREPASRAYSAYHYAKLRGLETCDSFEDALAKEESRAKEDSYYWASALYLRNSTYAQNLVDAIRIFGKERILVLFHEDYRQNPSGELEKIEAFIGQSLFGAVEVQFREHNRASAAKYPALARLIHRVLKSRNIYKKAMRSIIPHKMAVALRHQLLNANRVETDYPKINADTAARLSEKLAADREEIIRLVGRCAW